MNLSLDTAITRATLREVGACWDSDQIASFSARHGESMPIGAVLSCEGVTHAHRVWIGCAMLARKDPWLAFDAALEFARRSVRYAPETRRAELGALLDEVSTLRGASRERCADVIERCWRCHYAAYSAARVAVYAADADAAYATAAAYSAARAARADAAADRAEQLEILRQMIGGDQ